nr:DUF4738 domain-containing protein [Prevotella sp.]
MRIKFIIVLSLTLIFAGCKGRGGKSASEKHEDIQAKQLLQGIWVNDDDDNDIAFMAKGDTIYYPDDTSQPVYFKIVGDTLYMRGANITKYPILKQAQHLFEFKNQVGDMVKLIKSSNHDDCYAFGGRRPMALNQRQLIKRDTIVGNGDKKYHCYVQVNPTTYKVVKSTYNDDGVEVDNVYYDNIIHLSVFDGARQLFSRDFHKQDFNGKVPSDYLKASILSDLLFSKVDNSGVHYTASLCIPDSQSSYMVDICVSSSGSLSVNVLN